MTLGDNRALQLPSIRSRLGGMHLTLVSSAPNVRCYAVVWYIGRSESVSTATAIRSDISKTEVFDDFDASYT